MTTTATTDSATTPAETNCTETRDAASLRFQVALADALRDATHLEQTLLLDALTQATREWVANGMSRDTVERLGDLYTRIETAAAGAADVAIAGCCEGCSDRYMETHVPCAGPNCGTVIPGHKAILVDGGLYCLDCACTFEGAHCHVCGIETTTADITPVERRLRIRDGVALCQPCTSHPDFRGTAFYHTSSRRTNAATTK